MYKQLSGLVLSLLCASGGEARDPTRPPDWQATGVNAAAVSSGSITATPTHLSSIIMQKTANRALIDGQWLQVGQALGAWTLVQIQPKSVWFENAGQRLELSLLPVSVVIKKHTGN